MANPVPSFGTPGAAAPAGKVSTLRPGTDAEIEIRQVFEASDFGEEFTPELREQEERAFAAGKKS